MPVVPAKVGNQGATCKEESLRAEERGVGGSTGSLQGAKGMYDQINDGLHSRPQARPPLPTVNDAPQGREVSTPSLNQVTLIEYADSLEKATVKSL